MNDRFRLARHVRYRIIDDEAVVVRQTQGDVLVLNGVGARVLELVDQGLDQSAIGDRIIDEYESTEAAIREDVQTFLDQLEELSIIEANLTNGAAR